MATDNKSSGGTSSSGGNGNGSSEKPDSSKTASGTAASKRPVTIDLKAEKVDAKPGSGAASAAGSSTGSSSTGSASAGSSSGSSAGSSPGSSTGSASRPAGPASSGASSSSGTAKPGDAPKTGSSSVPGSGTSSSSSSSAAGGSSASAGSASTDGKSQAAGSTSRPASSATPSSAGSGSSTSSATASKPASSTAKPAGSTSFSNPPAAEDSGGVGAFGVLIAAVIGGILVLGGGFGLYSAGLVKLPAEQNQQVANALSAAEQKIAQLESKLDEVTSSSSSQNVSSTLSALEKKVSDLETQLQAATSGAASDNGPALEALRKEVDTLKSEFSAASTDGGEARAAVDLQPLEARLSSLEEAVKDDAPVDIAPLEAELADLKKQLGNLETQLENTEATAKAAQTAVSTSDVSLKTLADSQARAAETLSGLAADIKSVGAANSAALEDIRAELKTLSGRLSQVESTMGDATARELAARALSVSALKSAVDSGRPYKTELAAVKAGLPADMDLGALASHADSGVEPASVLIAQFPAVARDIYDTFSAPDRSGDVFDNLLASARSIVSVRGPGDADGTGPEASLRRMENAVSSGDLEAALAAYKTLPEDAQAAGAEWAAKAEARVEVDALTDKASQEVLSALGAKDS